MGFRTAVGEVIQEQRAQIVRRGEGVGLFSPAIEVRIVRDCGASQGRRLAQRHFR